MAAWQFQCNIIPFRKNFDKLSHDEMISWYGIAQPIMDIGFLEQKESWSTDIVQYGNIEETCIEFFYDQDVLEEILCRLDLRTLTKHLFTQILEYVQYIEAYFLVDDKIYPPESECMIAVMKQSKANLFCKNPYAYLNAVE